jgi:hypothetical protein
MHHCALRNILTSGLALVSITATAVYTERFLQVDIGMLGLARALAPAAQPRLGRAAFPLLQRCRSYCQAQPESDSYSSSSKPRREVFVDNADDLDEVLESCDRSEYLAIDTEFVAFPSLVPKLQLVQVHRHNAHRFPYCRVREGSLVIL